MTSKMIFTIDSRVKKRAMQKAHTDGVPFSVILKLAARAYADNKLSLTLGDTIAFNKTTAREIKQALSDIKIKKNLSPSFQDTKEALKYLKK